MSRAERFEMQIPLALTDVEVFCKAIKAIHPEKKSLTPQELMTGMSALESWHKITSDSIFHKILKESDLLKDQENKAELSKNALLLWGIVLCGGKSLVKVKAFYDVLQDNNQERISAEDKDFPGNFTLMIDLATFLVNHYEAEFSGKETERSIEFVAKLDSIREKIAEEDFLDKVFDENSNLTRAEWEKQVIAQVKWIFDSSKLRAHIYGKVEKL